MGQNIQTVIIAGEGGTAGLVDADGNLKVISAPHVDVTINIATLTRTTSGTDISVIAAPGSGVRIVLVGVVCTISAVAATLLHWGTGTSSPVLDFSYLTGSGVAYHWGAYGLKGGDNQALLLDLAATANLKITAYYYTEAV